MPHRITPTQRAARPAQLTALASACMLIALVACQAQAPEEATAATSTGFAETADTSATTADVVAPAATEAHAADGAGTSATVAPDVLKAIVDDTMRAAYGANSFDAAKGCWKHTFETPNDELDYCMKAGPAKVVAAASGTQVYFQAYSDPQADTYALVDPGLRGLFAASVAADGTWKPLAATPSIDQGQAGDCACQNAQLVQVGPDRHGWLSTAGGTWQGQSVAQYALHVPVSGTFVDVSKIPRTRDSAPDETVEIAFDKSASPVDGFYPITATRQRAGADVGKTTIAYDPKQKAYSWAQ